MTNSHRREKSSLRYSSVFSLPRLPAPTLRDESYLKQLPHDSPTRLHFVNVTLPSEEKLWLISAPVPKAHDFLVGHSKTALQS